MSKELIIDPATLDLDHPIAGLEDIRRYNLQRHEMEHLTAIVLLDNERGIAVGYRDTSPDEFWVRGHMPGYPLMPGVIMCEAAAQLCSYFTQKFDLLGAKVVGFGGLDDVSFRGQVLPGDRLVLVVEKIRCRRGAMIVAHFQGFVRGSLVVEGKIKGIPLPIDDPQYDS
ncbi:MAG: 3-hydroxyacyl-ACP dehydratase FabZ family protein [Pirellulales bacterium]